MAEAVVSSRRSTADKLDEVNFLSTSITDRCVTGLESASRRVLDGGGSQSDAPLSTGASDWRDDDRDGENGRSRLSRTLVWGDLRLILALCLDSRCPHGGSQA